MAAKLAFSWVDLTVLRMDFQSVGKMALLKVVQKEFLTAVVLVVSMAFSKAALSGDYEAV
jgi:hypothetical protein